MVAAAPVLYTGMLRGQPANRCVDACRILHHPYAQLGLRSQLRAVDLGAVTPPGAGRGSTIARMAGGGARRAGRLCRARAGAA